MTRLAQFTILFVSLAAVAAVARAAGWPKDYEKPLEVAAAANTERLVPYQVFELTFQHGAAYPDPTWDVTIEVTFASPTGKICEVGGFFYGSSKPQAPEIRKGENPWQDTAVWPCDPADLWKARYAPSEAGEWTYAWTFTNPDGRKASGQGAFKVVPGRTRPKGWIRFNPANPFRFVFDDGTPYFPLGFEDGFFDPNHNGSGLDAVAMEGPFSLHRNIPTPPGAMYMRGPTGGPRNADEKLRRFAEAGFNMFRFSPNNFSMKVFAAPDDERKPSLDHVRWEQAIMVDELLRANRRYGLRNFYGFFGYHKVFNFHPADRVGMAKVKRLIKYSVDRWGAYIDIYQFLNEQYATDEWYAEAIDYLKSIDPYGRPITTSWPKAELDGIDIYAPHWYQTECELTSDLHVAMAAARRKTECDKLILYGEQGNRIDPKKRREFIERGNGGVWDPGSARRMRVRTWAALLNETHFVFWETSHSKDSHYMNIWIGPQERQYLHALQDIAERLDAKVVPAPIKMAGPQAADVRGYALASDERALVYLHHVACAQCGGKSTSRDEVEGHDWTHDRGEVKGLTVTLSAPGPATAYWYDTRTANILARVDVPAAGERTFEAPPFAIDLALLVTDAGAPDIDGDGIANDRDDDDDNDGRPDAADAWPLEREEWADADGDRIGDNLDADIDADGKRDHPENPDPDGDGVPTAGAVPWDAFPLDPAEWRDTDGDGIGDHADTDDDGDGYTDAEEAEAGTDPLKAISFPG